MESTDPIKLTLHDWTGQLITTQIMGEVLKKAGYNIEYVQADYLAQFAGLKTGDLHVAMEIWETTGREAMDAATATGNVENLGPTGMQAKEEWWYPSYMKSRNARACRTGKRSRTKPAPRPSHRRNCAQGALSGRAGDLGRL
jgi:glycine betaine/proline transport system substrate-binding protein